VVRQERKIEKIEMKKEKKEKKGQKKKRKKIVYERWDEEEIDDDGAGVDLVMQRRD